MNSKGIEEKRHDAQQGRHHRAIRVCVGEMDELIDEEIAPLIRELWLAGIETHMSCQEAPEG